MDFSEADLQVFTDSVTRYFSHTTADAADVEPPFVKADEDVLLDYTGIIGISGQVKGAIYFSAEEELLSNLLHATGMGDNTRDEDVLRDLVGEVANTMSGSARQHFGSNFLVSVPIVLSRGQNFRLPDYLLSHVIPITWRGFRANLIVCLGHGSAVYGALRDIPAEEVLGMAARGSSTLQLNGLPGGKTLRLTVHRANLRSLLANGEPVLDALTARAHITELLKTSEGTFELLREPTKDTGSLYLPLKQLILSGLADSAAASESQSNQPLPETVFVLTDQSEYWIQSETQAFLDLAMNDLRAGASANMIAAHTGLTLLEVTARLYHLQVAGLITPMRAYARAARIPLQAISPRVETSPAPEPMATGLAPLPPAEIKPMLERLPLAAPRVNQETPRNPEPEPALVRPSFRRSPVPPASARSSLVGRLLSGLKQRLLQP